MLDGGANVCCISSADMEIVYKPERPSKPISIEGIHGTPEGSNIMLDGFSFICLCQVYIPVYVSDYSPQSIVSDGILTDHGFQVSTTRGRVGISRLYLVTYSALRTPSTFQNFSG